MATIIQAKTNVAGATNSGWIDVSTKANVLVGVDGTQFFVEFNLGSNIIYSTSQVINEGKKAVVVAKANEVRVSNRGPNALDFEVWG